MHDHFAFDLHLAKTRQDFVPLELRGSEHVNRPFHFHVRVAVAGSEVAAFHAAVLEQAATILLPIPDAVRAFYGVVDGLSVVEATADGQVHVMLRIVPRFDLLRHKKQSRIFQHQTTREIAETIFRETGIASRFALTDELPSRVYACQYRETDFAFVHRVFAEDGLFYWFEHGDTGPETLVVADSAHAYAPIRGERALVFAPHAAERGVVVAEHHVTRLSTRTRMRPTSSLRRALDVTRPALAVRDQAGERPGLATLGNSSDDRPLVRQLLAHEDHLGAREEARTLDGGASRLLDALRRDAVVARGTSACRRLEPGHAVRFDGSPADIGSDEWVVTRVNHRVRAPQGAAASATYENRFACLPRAMPARPAPRSARPTAICETAVVVGPPGQEIHTDELGRVKVQFHWDLDGRGDDGSSCWLRVQQAWLGANMGAHFVPRVGMQVLVGFVGGDPDRPVVTGCLADGARPPPHNLPEGRTRSGIRTRSSPGGVGFNELMFEDQAGAEAISMRSEGNIGLTALGNHVLSVRGDTHCDFGGSHDECIGGGSTTRVEGTHQLMVAGSSLVQLGGGGATQIDGNRAARIKGSDSVRVMGDVIQQTAGSVLTAIGLGEAGGNATTTIGGIYAIDASADVRISSGRRIELRVGESVLTITSEGISLRAPKLVLEGPEVHLQAARGKTALVLGDALELGADKISITSAGAALILDAVATLQGAQVKLKSGGGGSGQESAASVTDDGVATFLLTDYDPAGPDVLLRVRHPDGECREHRLDSSGSVSLKGEPGDQFVLVDVIRAGMSLPVRRVKS